MPRTGRAWEYIAIVAVVVFLVWASMMARCLPNPIGAGVASSSGALRIAWGEITGAAQDRVRAEEGRWESDRADAWAHLTVTARKEIVAQVRRTKLPAVDPLTEAPFVVSAALERRTIALGRGDPVPIIWTRFSEEAGGRVVLMSSGYVSFLDRAELRSLRAEGVDF